MAIVKVKPILKAILKERNMKQIDLAIAAGIPQAAISRFDNNSQHNDDHLFSIAKVLGVTVNELFDIEETS